MPFISGKINLVGMVVGTLLLYSLITATPLEAPKGGGESNIKKKLPGSIRSYSVKENHIGSVVSKILQYTQTDRDPVTLFKDL